MGERARIRGTAPIAALAGFLLAIVAAQPAALADSTAPQPEAGKLPKISNPFAGQPKPFSNEVGPNKETPTLLSADQITYQEDLGLVVATGHVEISQGNRVLLADTVTYNRKTGSVTASGNVSITEPSKDVIFGSYVEVTSDLKDGIIKDMRALLADRAKIASPGGKRTNGTITTFNNGVYSPCELCANDPTRAPLWQIKAARIVHDTDSHEVYYKDAWLELYGVPVLYTPYFSMPDPSVKRKTGFLTPNFSLSQNLGFTATVPYYFNIAPDKDATFEPQITSKRGVVLAGQYRQRFDNGEIIAFGSILPTALEGVDADSPAVRGNINSQGRFDLDETWRWGFDAQRESDKTYARLYGYGTQRTLTSDVFVEGFQGRSYALAQTMAFQGTRQEDKENEEPIIAPQFLYSYVGEPADYGGYYTLDSSIVAVNRIEGRQSRRLSVKGGWQMPYYDSIGDVFTFSATVEADGYWVDNVDPGSNNVNPRNVKTFSGVTGRIFPQGSAQWRYPLVRQGTDTQQVIQPIAEVVVGPNKGNQGKIPNEDSLDFEFDDTSLFFPDRFTGIDRVDTGQRVDYGLDWTLYGNKGSKINAFLGQSYRFNQEHLFGSGSGLENKLSNLVGHFEFVPMDELDLLYNYRIDLQKGELPENEVRLQAGPAWLNTQVSYLFLRKGATSSNQSSERSEIAATINAKLGEYWTSSLFGRRNLATSTWREYGLNLDYQDECFLLRSQIAQRNFRDKGIQPETRILFQIVFKNLGSVSF